MRKQEGKGELLAATEGCWLCSLNKRPISTPYRNRILSSRLLGAGGPLVTIGLILFAYVTHLRHRAPARGVEEVKLSPSSFNSSIFFTCALWIFPSTSSFPP